MHKRIATQNINPHYLNRGEWRNRKLNKMRESSLCTISVNGFRRILTSVIPTLSEVWWKVDSFQLVVDKLANVPCQIVMSAKYISRINYANKPKPKSYFSSGFTVWKTNKKQFWQNYPRLLQIPWNLIVIPILTFELELNVLKSMFC